MNTSALFAVAWFDALAVLYFTSTDQAGWALLSALLSAVFLGVGLSLS